MRGRKNNCVFNDEIKVSLKKKYYHDLLWAAEKSLGPSLARFQKSLRLRDLILAEYTATVIGMKSANAG